MRAIERDDSVYLIYTGAGILILGIGAVIWIFVADKRTPATPPTPKPANNLLTTSQILSQLGLHEDPELPPDTSTELRSDQSAPPGEHERGVAPSGNRIKTQGTAALRLGPEDTDDESEKRLIAQNEQLKQDITEMQSKNEKLEALLDEKNKEIEHVMKDLEMELKNRKEFNKIKDILEKELKDSKEKNRSLQIDLTQTQTEADSYLKRVKQLEEKTKKIAGEVEEKDGQLKEQQGETDQHKKRLEALDKKLKGFNPVIAEKDQKINSLVPLLKDLPEKTPDLQPQEPAPGASPDSQDKNAFSPDQNGKEGGLSSPSIGPEKNQEEQNFKNGPDIPPVGLPQTQNGQDSDQLSPATAQHDSPKESEKEPDFFNGLIKEQNLPAAPGSNPINNAAEYSTPDPQSPTEQPEPVAQPQQTTIKPSMVDDVERIRRLASSDSVELTPKNLLETIEADISREKRPDPRTDKQEDRPQDDDEKKKPGPDQGPTDKPQD